MNLALAVVAEIDDLTVGGLINGYEIEGSAHLYGLLSDTVVSTEVVLADGRVVRCTKDNDYSDPFFWDPLVSRNFGSPSFCGDQTNTHQGIYEGYLYPVQGNIEGACTSLC